MKQKFCRKHSMKSSDEGWEVVVEEMVDSGDWPFEGEICPCCFLDLVETLRKTKRQMKIESKSGIRLRRENSIQKDIIDAVMATVFDLTGKDPQKLAEKEYGKNDTTCPAGVSKEHGDLKNILPNLITEISNMKE